MIRRALESLACQTYGSIGVVLVQFHPVEGLDALIEAYRPRFASMRHVVIENDGNRSTSWWAGLRAVRADFFGMLDDDDTLFSNHVATVMAHLLERAEFGFVYSGIVRIQDEPGHFAWGPQFNGPAQETIEERRDLFCIESEHFSNLLPTTNIIGHNTWICRRALLDEAALVDPRIEWGEDVYFTALMAERTRFHFTAMATACWHWRSTSKDNWTLSHSERARVTSLRRWGERLQKANLPIWNSVSLPPELARFETHADDNL
jgi:phosphoglycerol transferase